MCGGREYVDDPSDEDNDAVAFVDVPSGTYSAEFFTFITSPNFPKAKSPWPEPPELGDRLYVDFLLRLTPWTEGFVCTPTNQKGWIPWTIPLRKPELAPHGIIAESPEGWTPEQPDNKSAKQPGQLDGEWIAPPGREHIRILSIPPKPAEPPMPPTPDELDVPPFCPTPNP